jgi:predicted O-methyltransferase YrrM
VSQIESSWKFAEELVTESGPLTEARQHSLEVGVEPVSPAVGAQLAVVAAASGAKNIIEIGTGVGVSGLWLLHGAPRATLTSIDREVDHQQAARDAYLGAGVPVNRFRLITGRASEVLPRMNENSYDIVFVDADPGSVIEYVACDSRVPAVSCWWRTPSGTARWRIPRGATPRRRSSARC